MTQRDKVKELVGRGLNSYHTKSLQQIDRIEKKNKEQNHKISILSNELDNDYLTKTEEGSVVSLEHSKEGMVYLDELQGNTLVNYCTDGSKELTLNGDIDLKGTFVTTTEGVDNGKVDIMCEGNTLVNKLYKIKNYGSSTEFKKHGWSSGAVNCKKYEWLDNGIKIYSTLEDTSTDRYYRSTPDKYGIFKKNRTYIVRMNVNSDNFEVNAAILRCFYGNGRTFMSGALSDVKNGVFVKKATTSSEIEECDAIHSMISLDYIRPLNTEGWVSFQNVIVIDITDLPSYQQDIEYWRNMNYFEGMKSVGQDDENGHKIEILSTNSDGSESNKKEILMNEPLRKANDFYRDRLVKIGNKCYIERNTKEVVLDGTHNVAISGTSVKDETLCRFDFTINGLMKGNSKDKQFICDTLPYLFIHGLAGGSTNVAQECITNHSTNENSLNMVIKKSRLETIDVTGVNKWLSNNNIKIIIPIATPIYEPLEIEPTLNTYNDVTHISNNSIIPCNMKIQNSGYNAIIKPSTLYTIALDTDKSGTIGMNLGGTKGTTTNNVLTLTTPATLTDDSLRLHGKGIKGSKVRLLEGDKTNWIPSHFEGMMSSFEDKFDATDNTYKMEILSNNQNLLILEKEPYFWRNSNKSIATRRNDKIIINGLVNEGWDAINLGYSSLLKSNTKYTITCKINQNINVSHGVVLRYKHNGIVVSSSNYLWSGGNVNISKFTFTTPRISFDTIEVGYMVTWDGDKLTQTYTNLEFSEIGINEVYNPNKSNKIQFSSIEPLRGVDNIKDKFVFKDGKLMIERNIGQRIYNGTENWGLYSNKDKVYWISIDEPDGIRGDVGVNRNCYTNKFTRVGSVTFDQEGWSWGDNSPRFYISLSKFKMSEISTNGAKQVLQQWHREGSPLTVTYVKAKPIYEEIPFELQKIILECYENGTLFFDTNIPPTSTVTYAGETPIVKSVKLNKTEVLNNTTDINDNIIPYLMDMDYRVVCLELATETQGISMARLFGGTYEMLKRDILSKRYSVEEYKYRLDAYLSVNKITEKEYEELGEMLNE